MGVAPTQVLLDRPPRSRVSRIRLVLGLYEFSPVRSRHEHLQVSILKPGELDQHHPCGCTRNGIQILNNAAKVLIDLVNSENEIEARFGQVDSQRLPHPPIGVIQTLKRANSIGVRSDPDLLEFLYRHVPETGPVIQDLAHDLAPNFSVRCEFALDDGQGAF